MEKNYLATKLDTGGPMKYMYDHEDDLLAEQNPGGKACISEAM
jgi:YD repeat-containing protein